MRRAGGPANAGPVTAGDRIRRGALGLLLTLALLVVGGVVGAGGAGAQSPAASPASGDLGSQVDPRSSGEGPGLEAEPLIVLAGVVLLGLAAAGGTALYVRLTRED